LVIFHSKLKGEEEQLKSNSMHKCRQIIFLFDKSVSVWFCIFFQSSTSFSIRYFSIINFLAKRFLMRNKMSSTLRMVGGGDGLHEDQHYVSENHDLNGSFSSVVSLRNEYFQLAQIFLHKK
jgi:hypothetical protein